jgi:hypothetical protein
MAFDIFNPPVSHVAEGIEGKSFLVYGSNSLGKTKQATRLPKPFHLGFEGTGLDAINGVPFAPINKWTDFKRVNKQLTDPRTLDKVHEIYQTIIFDEVEASALYCQKYIADKYGVETVGEGNEGFGLWKEYSTEYWTQIDKLLKAGFTVLFIAHQAADKDGKLWPKGDKRAIDPIRDNCNTIIFVKSNGVDKDGHVVKSTGYFHETPEFFARSRFDYIVPFIEEFTAENLIKAVEDAVIEQAKHDEVKPVSFEKQQESKETEEYNFDGLINEAKEIINSLITDEKSKKVNAPKIKMIVDKYLGKDNKLNEATEKQVEQVAEIVSDLKDLVE